MPVGYSYVVENHNHNALYAPRPPSDRLTVTAPSARLLNMHHMFQVGQRQPQNRSQCTVHCAAVCASGIVREKYCFDAGVKIKRTSSDGWLLP